MSSHTRCTEEWIHAGLCTYRKGGIIRIYKKSWANNLVIQYSFDVGDVVVGGGSSDVVGGSGGDVVGCGDDENYVAGRRRCMKVEIKTEANCRRQI